MSQKQLLDQALAEQNQKLATGIESAVGLISSKISDLNTSLAVKNQASQDIDLTSEIAAVKSMGTALDPLTALADSLRTPPAPTADAPASEPEPTSSEAPAAQAEAPTTDTPPTTETPQAPTADATTNPEPTGTDQ